MKNYKKKVSNQSNKIKQEDKESTDINKSVDWKKEREYLFTKIKNLEKEVNSLKTKNQELQIQLTLTQTSIESKTSFVVTDENIKEPQKRRVDHKRIYSEMFTSYRKKKLKQNSEDGRSGIGALKQLIKQKPKSFGECTKEIIGNKILSNIIKEFRIDLQEQKKLDQNYNNNNLNKNINKNINRNINKNKTINKNLNKCNTINNNHNTCLKQDINKNPNQKDNKFIKNIIANKINNYPNKKNNNNTNNNKCFFKNNTNNNNNNNNLYYGENKNNFNRKKIVCETINNTQNISSLADENHNKTYNQPKNENRLNIDLIGNNCYGFYNSKGKGFNEINSLNQLNNNENLIIDNDDFTEKINESSSGQTHRTGETVLKKPNDINSNINNSISNSLSNSTMKKSNSNNNNNNTSSNNVNEYISTNFNNLKNTPPSTISQNSSVIFQPYSKIDCFSSANSLNSKRSGGRNGPQSVLKFHLDSVRGIYIDPFQRVLTSVSEDKTMALWDL